MTEEAREARAPVWEAEVPWVVSYLREDIQDLRNEVRENRRSIERLRQDMKAKIERINREMSVQFRWTVGTIVAVGALIVAALKLLP